jgi:TPR repeat protein
LYLKLRGIDLLQVVSRLKFQGIAGRIPAKCRIEGQMESKGYLRGANRRLGIAVAAGLLWAASGVAQGTKADGAEVAKPFCVIQTSSTGTDDCDAESVRKLAESGQVYEENEMGMATALVVERPTGGEQARKWFEKAARKGYAAAQVNLATMYVYGWGVQKNYGTALNWLKEAAGHGYGRAYTNLGILYLNGWGVRRDYEEARSLFQNGAKAGDAPAMVDLGFLFDQGFGVAQDHAAAADWYRQAAEKGFAMGQYNLADLFLKGEGVVQSDPAAFELFRRAAAQGNTSAEIKLGWMYMTGRGTEKNLGEAYQWIESAWLAGDRRGEEYLREIEKRLKPEQVATAIERARIMQRGAAQNMQTAYSR